VTHTKKTITYDVRDSGPKLWQTQNCGGVKPVNMMIILIQYINGLPMSTQYINGLPMTTQYINGLPMTTQYINGYEKKFTQWWPLNLVINHAKG
jgi:hypothetical protein